MAEATAPDAGQRTQPAPQPEEPQPGPSGLRYPLRPRDLRSSSGGNASDSASASSSSEDASDDAGGAASDGNDAKDADEQSSASGSRSGSSSSRASNSSRASSRSSSSAEQGPPAMSSGSSPDSDIDAETVQRAVTRLRRRVLASPPRPGPALALLDATRAMRARLQSLRPRADVGCSPMQQQRAARGSSQRRSRRRRPRPAATARTRSRSTPRSRRLPSRSDDTDTLGSAEGSQ